MLESKQARLSLKSCQQTCMLWELGLAIRQTARRLMKLLMHTTPPT